MTELLIYLFKKQNSYDVLHLYVPFLFFPSSDIDECQLPDIYPCHGTCINVPGTYRCSSKKSIRSLPGTKYNSLEN